MNDLEMTASEKMAISIIVPIYNAEKYLEECIQSLLKQTYTNIEIVLVNDGSTDHSEDICLRFLQADARISYILCEHRGPVATRKTGIRQAKGRYVGFVDADDWVDPDGFEMVMRYLDDSIDMLGWGLLTEKKGSTPVEFKNCFPEGIYERDTLNRLYQTLIYDNVEKRPGIFQSLCTKLIRRSILMDCLDAVDDRITLGDDATFVSVCALASKKIYLIHKFPYHYRVHEDSMCNTDDIEVFARIQIYKNCLSKYVKKYPTEWNLEKQINENCIQYIQMAIKNSFQINLISHYVLPDFNHVPNARIVLYGAGAVGKVFYRQIQKNKQLKLVAWVDKNKAGEKVCETKIASLEYMQQVAFDAVVIAVKDEKLANNIKADLMRKNEIEEKKIVWEKPEIDETLLDVVL